MSEHPTWELGGISERQIVTLKNVTGLPNVCGPYMRTDVVIETVMITYVRGAGESAGYDVTATWAVDQIKVIGSRARKDGGPSRLGAEACWTQPLASGRYSRSAPEFLQDIALRYMPREVRVAEFLPGEPGADQVEADRSSTPLDLDALPGSS